MTKKRSKTKALPEIGGIPQMPFDDALRKILSAPPQHKETPKKKGKKK